MREDRDPRYTIKTAARRTAIPTATLRAWEKRYGIPSPARTPSRYRLYSETDLCEILWVRDRVREGIPPRQAARLAIERRRVGVEPDTSDSTASPALIADLKAACLAFDEDGALAVLRRAGSVMGQAQVLRTILLPAVAEIGRDWEAGLASVAQEHFTSQMTRRHADRLMDSYEVSPGLAPVVCACAPGEQHELGLMALAVELRRRALPVVYLGQDAPVDSVLSAIARSGARIGVVSVTMSDHLAPWIEQREEVASSLRGTDATIVWGGPAAALAGGGGLPGPIAATIDEAVEAITRRQWT